MGGRPQIFATPPRARHKRNTVQQIARASLGHALRAGHTHLQSKAMRHRQLLPRALLNAHSRPKLPAIHRALQRRGARVRGTTTGAATRGRAGGAACGGEVRCGG